jgi:hypothetical protein
MSTVHSTLLTIALATALCMAAQVQATTTATPTTPQDTATHVHMIACAMPDGTQEYHLFDYTTAPTYDLCTEVGGTAY